MRTVCIQLDIPDGYAIVSRPKEWDGYDEFINIEIPEPPKTEDGLNYIKTLDDDALRLLGNDSKITSWLSDQSSRLRGCNSFLLGVSGGSDDYQFQETFTKPTNPENIVIKIRCNRIVAFYPTSPLPRKNYTTK